MSVQLASNLKLKMKSGEMESSSGLGDKVLICLHFIKFFIVSWAKILGINVDAGGIDNSLE